MFSLLVTLLIIVLVFGVIFYVVGLIPLPSPWLQVARAILAIIFLLVLLNMFGVLGAPYWRVNLR